MDITLKIKKITVMIDSSGPDYVYLHLDMPATTYPFDHPDNQPSAKIIVAAGLGIEWVKKNFKIEPEVIKLG